MLLLSTFLVAFIITRVLTENCDNSGILVYEDLGCAPIYSDEKKCPIKYNCSGVTLSKKFCFFYGKAYKSGERVDSGPTVPPCHTGCSCFLESPKPAFSCAAVDCPEWFNSNKNLECYGNNTLDDCCPVGTICPPFEGVKKCVVEGIEYKEGQHFYPSNTCLICVCLKGFEGKFEEPFCRRRSCGQQLDEQWKVQSSCAPFYKYTVVSAK